MQRIAVVGALRTPFVKSFGVFENETPLSLSTTVVSALLNQVAINKKDISEIIWGSVVPNPQNPNVARDLVLFSGLPVTIPGFTLNFACASSLLAVQLGADAISRNRARVVIAGGVEVLSAVPITYSEEARRLLTKLSRTKNITEKLSLLAKVNPKSFLPQPPALAEPATGLTMGESAEVMAVKNAISREAQDAFAARSHQRAAAHQKAGALREEITPVWTSGKRTCVEADNIIREDTTVEALSKLKPAFSKPHGTITPGNASPLTDGAAAVLLCAEDYAQAHGLGVLGYIVDSVSVGVNPHDELLIGPAVAIPQLLQKYNLTTADVDLFEVHEAFAAQVLSCQSKLNNAEFCQKFLGITSSYGAIPEDKLNTAGGAIAFGHPFGATGARLIGHTLRLLKAKGGTRAIIAICAAGGMSQALLVETNGVGK